MKYLHKYFNHYNMIDKLRKGKNRWNIKHKLYILYFISNLDNVIKDSFYYVDIIGGENINIWKIEPRKAVGQLISKWWKSHVASVKNYTQL